MTETEPPIRICIGTESRTEIPRKVLQFSIEEHAAAGTRFEFHPLSGGDWRGTGPLRQYTGFSLLRWTIAERFDYSGKAIYLDADQLCLTDISELWRVDACEDDPEVCVWCTRYEHRPRRKLLPFLRERRILPESSVMLIDCAKAKGRLRAFAEIERSLSDSPTMSTYDDVMHLLYLTPPPAVLSPWWNVMDGRGGSATRFVDPRAKILHYTRVPSQPWFAPDHPGRARWEEHLGRSIEAGVIERDEIEAACARFSVSDGRPSGMHPFWKTRFVV